MRKLTTEEFIKRAKKIHGSIYDYSKVVYLSMHEYVEIVCSKHGSFFQTPLNHLKGHGCSLCTKGLNRRLSLDEVLHKFYEVHGDIYDYSNVVYSGTKKKIEIICSKHGLFYQTPEKHFSGHGCPKCAKNCKYDKDSFIKKAREVHGDLYDYSKVEYINSQTKVCIIDKEYGEFWQMPYAHIAGKGHWMRRAVKTNNTKRQRGTFHKSKPEEVVYKLLCEKFGVDHVKRQYTSSVYPFACDFYIDLHDLYLELNLYVTHGFHWFDDTNENDKLRLKKLIEKSDGQNLYTQMIYIWTDVDLKKRNCAIKNGLNYLVFWNNNLEDFMAWYNSFDDDFILKSF